MCLCLKLMKIMYVCKVGNIKKEKKCLLFKMLKIVFFICWKFFFVMFLDVFKMNVE